jgi:hypothetical protein
MRGLFSASGAYMLLCVLGCALLFFPWSSADVLYVDPTPRADGSYKAKGLPETKEILGYQLWQGIGSMAVFLRLLVFLVITGPLQPVPWWRSAVVMAGGVGIVGAVLLGMRSPAHDLESDLQTGRWVIGVSWGGANYTCLGLAVVLMLVAAIELRWSVARRRDGKGPGRSAAPDPAAGQPRE